MLIMENILELTGPATTRRRLRHVLLVLLVGVALVITGRSFAPGANGAPSPAAASTYVPQTRVYYVAADEVIWDYAPSGKDEITGAPFDDTANTYVQQGPQQIGSKYIKSLYREYTDATFKHLKPRPPQWQHLGMLGPVIRGVVGDTIKVVYRNNLDRPTSIHVHGVKYAKNSEGAPYADGTTGADKSDDAVPPNATYTYSYTVPERAGPGPMDGSSVMWMYHSHTNEVGDDYAGLVGPMIITAASMARPDGTPKDVDRELVMQFKVSSENQSPYLQRNIDKFTGNPASVNPDDAGFQESNQMHSINGYVFGNQPLSSVTMKVGEHVRWYLMGMGTEVDLHTPHWHANTVTANGMRTDVVSLLPATMITADMVPDDPGIWLFHCHVNDHITAGMITRYQVLP
jgi:FtsP/CotA-like multicopper oxidase with cupredoxin domain